MSPVRFSLCSYRDSLQHWHAGRRIRMAFSNFGRNVALGPSASHTPDNDPAGITRNERRDTLLAGG